MQTQDKNPLDNDKIVAFQVEHIAHLNIENKDHLIFKIPHLLKAYEALGNCYTFIVNDEYLCSAGIVTYWEGVGEAWFVMSDNIDIAKTTLCATVKKYIDNMMDTSFNRIQATVKVDDQKSIRFIEWLGFERVAMLEKYGFEGADYYLFARI